MSKGISILALKKAIHANRGNISAVARSFNVSRSTIANRVSKSDTLKKEVEAARDAFDDEVENVHYDAILEPSNVAERIFHMKTRMKHRGYVERQEVTGADGNELVINVRFANEGD